MEQILSILLPCCFGRRHVRSPARSAADANERTPLLADGSQSIASGSGSIADSSAAQAKRKRKPQSILPTPAYDEHTLRNILDDLSARLVDVESAKTHADKQSILTSPPLATPEESTDKPGSGRAQSSSRPFTHFDYQCAVHQHQLNLLPSWSISGQKIPKMQHP